MCKNDLIKLIETTITTNLAGDTIETFAENEIIAEIKSINQSEFYQAGATDLKPELKFIVWSFEYKGESKIIYDDILYKVIRTYDTGDKTELTCTKGGSIMAVPSPVKFTKDGVEYISYVAKTQYTLNELVRGALKDCGKFLVNKARAKVPVKTGALKENITYWVKKGTELQVGVYTWGVSKKKGKRIAPHAHLIELGSSIASAKPFLKPAVQENIDEIQKIQAMYLSAIDDERKALALIDESEGEGE